ncbi:H-2 class II histocompatibility antigen, A-U alpha chain-like isoform X2 [Myxocyprinus asiaticus]|uniref:H-2 class II histocompatibility antigen, A-U alpha chain-like isoform X2 n=1 Tax=Myxocyprinus asiaticus TaxID=70543 RepID=UPI0022227D82|nr:H-2 class II histocompatibility antigen, A-U alpha chain-like isoform X2 [Myxocyprinus asiaticus]
MVLYVFLFMFTGTVSTHTKVVYRDIQYSGCSDTETEFIYGLDGEELYHSDFNRQEGIVTAPNFADPVSFPGFYDLGVALTAHCKVRLAACVKAYNNPNKRTARPEASIYSKDDVMLGIDNTLICHVTGLYPPPVVISWTKNNVNVTEDINLSQYRPRTDGTFNIFSTLKFIPEEGDIYTCTVYHKALENKPETKIWVDVVLPSVGLAVFCGVGLTLVLLGVATGTFFLIKGNNCN